MTQKKADTDESMEEWELVDHATVKSTITATLQVMLTDFLCTAFCFALFWIGTPIWAHGLVAIWWRPTHVLRWLWKKFVWSLLYRSTKPVALRQ